MAITNKITNRWNEWVKRQWSSKWKEKRIIKDSLLVIRWVMRPDRFFIITALYCLSVLCGVLLPRYLVDISQSGYKVPDFNGAITTRSLAVGIVVYIALDWLENHHNKNKQPTDNLKPILIMFAKVLLITIPLITIDVSNNITTKPIINNEYHDGVKSKNYSQSDYDTITTKSSQTYQINDDHYVEEDDGNNSSAEIKLLYNQPLEIIYPKNY